MWVIYRKSDQKIVGLSADTDVETGKEEALREAVEGLADAGDPAGYDAVQVQDYPDRRALVRAISRGEATVGDSESGELNITGEASETSFLSVSTDAEEHHPADGVPLIPADGKSFLTVTLTKVDAQGQPLARKKDNDVVWIRTSQGSLRAADGESPKEIRSVKLSKGTASFRLYSESHKRIATVEILSTDPNLRGGVVRVEFI